MSDSTAKTDDLGAIVNRLAKAIYDSKQGIDSDPEFLQAQAEQLLDAVFSGFGADIADVTFDSPDFGMLDKLVQNTFSFSGAKNWQEINDITQAMRDGDRLLPFSDFMEKVKAINIKYNVDWLCTEYDTAISSAQSAARWTEFELGAETHPLLKYQTIGDSRVRYSHAILNGVTRPIKDDFWTLYYPPNGWNCRCEAIQARDGEKKTKVPVIKENSVPSMFRTNLAQKGMVFPMGHPYYVGIPDGVLDKPTQRAVNKYYERRAFNWVDKNVLEGITKIKLDNFKSGGIDVSRASLKRNVIEHFAGSDKLLVKNVMELLPNADFIKSEKLIETKPNFKTKVKRGVTAYNYYSLNIGKNDYVINTEVIGGYEKLYAVRQKEKRN